MSNKQLIPSEGKLAQFRKQLQPSVTLLSLSNSVFLHAAATVKKITVCELTNTGYTYQRDSNTSILFNQYPAEDEILCISRDFCTTRQCNNIVTWQFIYPISGE